jgi:hypothetical protein
MSKVVTRGLRRQLKLEALQQPVHEVVQPYEQPCSQVEGTQLVESPNNEPQQPVTVDIHFHQILAE